MKKSEKQYVVSCVSIEIKDCNWKYKSSVCLKYYAMDTYGKSEGKVSYLTLI